MEGSADIAVGAMTINFARESVIDFTKVGAFITVGANTMLLARESVIDCTKVSETSKKYFC